MSRVKLDELWFEDSDDKLYRRVSGGFREVSPSAAGGEGAVNYAKNPLEEDSLSQLTYSGVTPAWSTTHNLFGGGALRCNMTSSGTGRYLRIALDDLSDAQITEMLRLSFFYKLVTGGDDAVRLSIWDGTNHTYLTPEYLVSASSDITKYDGWCYSISKTSHYLQFTFKDATAIDFYVAAVSFVPRVLPQGAVISEWRSYTPTFQGFGAVTGLDAKWRRVGSSLEVQCRFTSGTVSGSGVEARMSLPENLQIGPLDVANKLVGMGTRNGGGSYSYATPILATSGNTFLNFGMWAGNNLTVCTNVATYFIASSEPYAFTASVPISGWTSSINLVTEAQEFASNSSSTNADDTTSFVYGPQGSTGVIGVTSLSAVRKKRVRFKNRINSDDRIVIEVGNASGNWFDQAIAATSDIFLCPGFSYRSRSGGITYIQVNETDLDIQFNLSPDGASTNWDNAALVGYKWRVRKVSHGNMAEAPASGIYESGSNANGYYVKYVDGTMVQWLNELTVTNTGASAGSITATLPATFANTSYSGVATKVGGSAAAFGYLGTKTATTVIVGAQQKDSSALGTVYVDVILFGKWNLSRSVAAPGTPVGASTVFASASNTTSRSVISGTPIQFESVVEDTLSCITTGASWRFTAPVSGLYLINVVLYMPTNCTVSLYKNTTSSQIILGQHLTVAGNLTGSAVIRLSQGDYIQIIPNNTAGNYTTGNIQITRLSA